jgi:nuclear receptor co-repressor 1
MNAVSSLLNPWTGYEREYLKMPSMVPRNTARSWHCFETKNAIVENPIAAEMERKLTNPWSAEERKIFLDKYALLGKDFRKIASFLEYKSVADCIEFYYKNQKHEEFQKIHKRHQLKKRRDSRASGLYLATTTSASTRHREANHACMEGLTLVAAAAAAISAPRKSTGKEGFPVVYWA